MQDLRSSLFRNVRQRDLLESMRNLQRRSLIKKGRNGFSLDNVVTEYLTDRLTVQIADEITSGKIQLLDLSPLLLARARSYIRRIHGRLILQPIASQLLDDLGQQKMDAPFGDYCMLYAKVSATRPATPQAIS